MKRRLDQRVAEAVAEHGLWAAGDRVAVAVSGGLDSVVLLDLLARTAGWHGADLGVVTVDHGTRPGAAADADFVVDLARARGLPARRIALDLGAQASEAACRAARFAAFGALDVDAVALAHHRDDQAETVLVNLLRGTSPAGLEGMGWRRDRYVRPLLSSRRAEIEAWAGAHDLSWRDDPTNADHRFLRNRIRRRLLPLLEEIREGSADALARSATLAAEVGAFLDARLDDDPGSSPGPEGWSTRWLAEAPRALARRALHRHVAGLRTAHADAVLAAADRGSGRIALPGGRAIEVGPERTRLAARAD